VRVRLRPRFSNPLTRLNMKRQLALLFLIIMVPVYALHLYGSWKAEQILKNNVTSAYMELNKQNYSLIEREIDTINKITRTILQNPALQRLASPEQYSAYERIKQFEALDELLESYSTEMSGSRAVDYSFYAYDPDGYFPFAPSTQLSTRGVYFFGDGEMPDWYPEALEKKGTGYLKIFAEYGSVAKQPTLAYVRAVNSVERANRPIGVLVATGVEHLVRESLNTVTLPEGEIFFTSGDDLVLASSAGTIGHTIDVPGKEKMSSYQGIYNVVHEDHLYVVHYNSYRQQKLVYRIPLEALLSRQTELRRAIRTITIGLTFAVMLFMFYFWRSLMNPLQRLVGFVRQYEPGGSLPAYRETGRNDEIGVLMSSVHAMASRLNALFENQYKLEIKQREAQLKLLYEQINPHLLYNTLESIYWKCSLDGHSESAQMIKELSKLMRIALSRGKELIPLRDELEHARAYVNLQKMRYDYGFRVRWDVDEALLTTPIPKITLQPLIENAILHGVKAMEDEGEIAVVGRIEDGRAVILVADNGYREPDLALLRRLVSGEEADPDRGYGIRNIQQRIRLHFGDSYGLSYEKRDGGGLAAKLELPLRPEPNG
jgi:Predicted signal transduction protein with a C-terminal ATPase domain